MLLLAQPPVLLCGALAVAGTNACIGAMVLLHRYRQQESLCRKQVVVQAAKELHFNKNMEALKRMQRGADKLATVVGVTLGPKVRLQPALN
jgi:hypothetical protein